MGKNTIVAQYTLGSQETIENNSQLLQYFIESYLSQINRKTMFVRDINGL